jgi:hypothetical protein
MSHVERMRDAAFAASIPADWDGAVAGYYGAPGDAYNVWDRADWKRFPRHRKLPVWVADYNGRDDGAAAVAELQALKVPARAYTAVDMELRVDKTYLEHFGEVLGDAGYKVWVYGSSSSVFGNPHLDGWWVACYAGIGPFMFDHPDIRATQFRQGDAFDSSTVKEWTYDDGTWWR